MSKGHNQFRPVDSLNDIKQLNGFRDLVTLERPNEMQLNAGITLTQLWPFFLRFLNTIFAKYALPDV